MDKHPMSDETRTSNYPRPRPLAIKKLGWIAMTTYLVVSGVLFLVLLQHMEAGGIRQGWWVPKVSTAEAIIAAAAFILFEWSAMMVTAARARVGAALCWGLFALTFDFYANNFFRCNVGGYCDVIGPFDEFGTPPIFGLYAFACGMWVVGKASGRLVGASPIFSMYIALGLGFGLKALGYVVHPLGFLIASPIILGILFVVLSFRNREPEMEQR